MKNFIVSPKTGVPFVSVSAMSQLVNKIGVENCLQQLVDRIEQDFLRWDLFDKSPRYASHSSDGVIELMPISDGNYFGCKYVNGHPINTKRDLQTVTAFGILSDVDTGYPILISEMCLLTALRTAATSALVAKYGAPKNAQTAAIIGNGAQCEFQILALKAVLGITKFNLYDIDQVASEKVVKNLKKYDLNLSICTSIKEAVSGVEIITTCTADKKNATILSDDMVKPGMYVNAIGGDCPGKTELDANILKRADKVWVEYEPQTRIEGDIQQLADDFPVTEFHHIVKAISAARENDDELIVFDGVGFASEDLSALIYIRDLLIEQGSPELLDLITQQADPRNLFSVL